MRLALRVYSRTPINNALGWRGFTGPMSGTEKVYWEERVYWSNVWDGKGLYWSNVWNGEGLPVQYLGQRRFTGRRGFTGPTSETERVYWNGKGFLVQCAKQQELVSRRMLKKPHIGAAFHCVWPWLDTVEDNSKKIRMHTYLEDKLREREQGGAFLSKITSGLTYSLSGCLANTSSSRRQCLMIRSMSMIHRIQLQLLHAHINSIFQ